jgi:MATE family multidrug resistance protein
VKKLLTLTIVLNTIPFGIGVAASARVGNLIGARSPVAAKYAAHASALLSVVVGSIVMIIMMATKDVCKISFVSINTEDSYRSMDIYLVTTLMLCNLLPRSCLW